MYVSTFDGFFLFTQSTVGVLSLSSFSASFCPLDGAGPGPVLKADCEDEVAPSSVEHCLPALPWVGLVVHLEMLFLQMHFVLQWDHLVPMLVLHCSMHPVHPAVCCR